MEAGEEDEESDSEEECSPQADSGLPHARYNKKKTTTSGFYLHVGFKIGRGLLLIQL